MATIWMFSGQGSQYANMGRSLWQQEPTFRRSLERLDQLAQQYLGESVLQQLYRPGSSTFERIRYTHPAIFMVEYALAQLLLHKSARPDALLGASLGELTAAAVSEAFSVEACMEFVCRQALVLEKEAPPGGMIAVLAAPEYFHAHAELHQHSELAGVNFARHFVIAGAAAALPDIEYFLQQRGITFQRLPVGTAFHSRHIEPLQSTIAEAARVLEWHTPRYPLISCYLRSEVDRWQPDHFWQVVRNPIYFADTLAYTERSDNHCYVDLGPSGTLSNFVKYGTDASSDSTTVSLMTPYGDDAQRLQRYLTSGLTATAASPMQTQQGKDVNRQPVAWMFPGQGAQFKGMGAGLFEKYPQLVQQADAILGYPIAKLCLEDPERKLSDTRYTQPALYVVNCLSWLEHKKNSGQEADYYFGHSLGEYNALYAAGVFDFATGLRLVQERGRLMGEARGGGMVAVLNLSESQLRALLAESEFNAIDIANLNAPGQIVVSGPRAALEALLPRVEQASGTLIPLNVSAAFHSRYMREAGEAFSRFISEFRFNLPYPAVVANVSAQPYPAESASIAHLLSRQISHPVNWIASVQYLYQQGVTEFIEIGPGHVLTGLVDKIKRQLSAVNDVKASAAPKAPNSGELISPHQLGAARFRQVYNVKSAYASGAMYKGIASVALVVRMAKNGYLSFFGAGGIRLADLDRHLIAIRSELTGGETFGMNLLCDLANPQKEIDTVELYLRHQVSVIEAAAFMQVTPALVLFRARGAGRTADGRIDSAHRIIVKISRPEVARAFISPAPEAMIETLRQQGLIDSQQAQLMQHLPVASDLCVEADSGGHTDMGSLPSLLPSIVRLRDELVAKYRWPHPVLIGAAGGIGTPESAACAFMLGADFIVTGSINQCSVEAGNSEVVKEMLQAMDVQDTDYAPAGDMFELGARVQVLKRGVFFAARANKLYEIWRNSPSLEAIDAPLRTQIEKNYFRRSFEEVWQETREHYQHSAPEIIAKAESNPKFKMALIFRWYFIHSTRMAMQGEQSERVNFQIHCGPALGAFNQWVKGTALESWRKRHVDHIADVLMDATAAFLQQRMAQFSLKQEG
ncbi:ACP S-malonyltransferase [Xenorhabdus bovienii]|uniref:ACP S-malonyltransferase n=1 Tax=Xenorhabdus bovienii TaxID=40576 RepID=UPI0023B23490|nr:ACP S-malonyltransferase [Xenorhabdus bovienii]MDE9482415.1 ACP S-malonyltransferase [Xenorhabdus bovienii]MDE9556291.1 ACP S-malonyltransferase [Xenorhabdus bovienii]